MSAKRPASAPEASKETVSFGVRLDTEIVARLDAYAAAHQHKRGWALARVVAAGLEALEGQGRTVALAGNPQPGENAPSSDEPRIQRIAEAVAYRLKPQLSTALFEAGLSAGRAESSHLIGKVADAAELLQSAVRRSQGSPGVEARAEFAAAVHLAIVALSPCVAILGRSVHRSDSGDSSQRGYSRSGLADALKAARRARHLTQREAAAQTGLTSAVYKRAERAVDVGEETAANLWAWSRGVG
jgi:hypothetical protein